MIFEVRVMVDDRACYNMCSYGSMQCRHELRNVRLAWIRIASKSSSPALIIVVVVVVVHDEKIEDCVLSAVQRGDEQYIVSFLKLVLLFTLELPVRIIDEN